MREQAYFLFDDRSAHSGEPPASGLYVLGAMKDGQFVPSGDILGDGDLGESTTGWLELRDGSFYGQQTARPPIPPYVEGTVTDDGRFVPASRKVHR